MRKRLVLVGDETAAAVLSALCRRRVEHVRRAGATAEGRFPFLAERVACDEQLGKERVYVRQLERERSETGAQAAELPLERRR